ncbi:MAG: leucyl/phenylalanyl-tRNA--protein transferase [Betaproteobacteria bacterium]|nr:leucyl/phenylalanyl-tRNA--protein transferase [Betaproteobacteria bacterium]MBI3938582.1 leucyl/phenylalanyl-tRNA--protein transferase [Betaproteobacteria bacterium]
MIPWLGARDRFPPVERALAEPNGLLAAGADLSVPRLIEAYRSGIFPWYSDGQPLLWWSPDPRMVLIPAELKLTRSLRKRLAKSDYEVRADTAFEAVIRACAAPRAGQEGTWITGEMIAAYTALARAGHAHSVETWIGGELAGGLYGVAIGRMCYGESMFTQAPDASKIALAHLARQLARWGYGMIDCQMTTAHLARFGAREIPRAEFMRKLATLVNYPDTARKWRLDDDLFD